MKLSIVTSGLEKYFKAANYSPVTVKAYQKCWRTLAGFLEKNYGDEEFDESRAIQFLEKRYGIASLWKGTGLSGSKPQVWRSIRRLVEYQRHGSVSRRLSVAKECVGIKGPLASVYIKYLDALPSMKLSGATCRHYSAIARNLLGHFRDLGLSNPDQVRLEHCHSFLKTLSGLSPKTVQQIVCGMRHLLRFMFSHHDVKADLAPFIRAPRISRLAGLPYALTADEVAGLLAAVDRTSLIGKRDYAMMVLGSVYGLRFNDVANLRIGNFDFIANKLRLRQHKTGRILELPLPDRIGWAVLDYIKATRSRRGETDAAFLRDRAPIEPLEGAAAIHGRMGEYMEKAHIARSKKRGFHALRHSAATMYLEMGTQLPVISEILGHASSDTTAIYLKEDIKKLAECVLKPEDFTDGK